METENLNGGVFGMFFSMDIKRLTLIYVKIIVNFQE